MPAALPLPLPDITAELQAAVDDVYRVRAWLAFSLPADLRAEVEARLATAHARLVDRLLAWLDLGGEIQPLPPPAKADRDEEAEPLDPAREASAPPEPVVETASPDPDPVLPAPAAPAPPPRPRLPPASPEQLRELAEQGIGGARVPTAAPPPNGHPRGPHRPAAPARPPLATPETKLREIEALLSAFNQEGPPPDERTVKQLQRLILDSFQPPTKGGVGLRRDDPRLVRLVADHVHLLTGDVFKKTRRAVRDAEDAEEDASASPADRLPSGWLDRYGEVTRGRRGVMVGGCPRKPQWNRIRETFGFAELDWIGTEYKHKGLDRVRARVVRGGVGVVLALHRWTGHDVDAVLQPTCKEHGVLYLPVQQSYGVTGIRRAIERFFAR